MKMGVAAWVLAAAVLIPACIDDLSSPPVSRSEGPRAQRSAQQPGRPQTIDDEFAAIASAEPSFGGFFLDSTHSPVVYLTDPTRLGAARAAGLDVSLSKRRIAAGNIRVVAAAYGFGALKRWYDCAAPQVLGLPNALLTDIDEVHNRLHFGVADASVEGDVQTVVARCGIPSEAVTVDVVPPVRPRAGGLNETVRDSVRPIRGGVLIAFNNGNPPESPCTLGIVGESGEGKFFITASHCSQVYEQLDTATYWQTVVGDTKDSIGIEAVDPTYFTYPDMGCPSGKHCRMSDATLIRMPATADAQVGLIARTLDPSHWTYAGSLDLDHDHPGLFITAVDESPGPVVGDSVCKTGQKTGTTCGIIQTSCANLNSTGVRTMICQMNVFMYSEGGDSGSPVYHWNSSADSTVRLAGILWGGPNDYYTWYSQWDWVEWELFRADTVTVIAFPSEEPGPIGVDLSGPMMMRPNVTCTWTATAHGTPPYTYDWTANPYAQSFSETTDGSSTATFEGGETGASVRVSVTDANGGSGSASGGAQVDEYLNENCQ